MTRPGLTLVRPEPVARCEHTEQRALVWACTLPEHGPDRAHVMRASR